MIKITLIIHSILHSHRPHCHSCLHRPHHRPRRRRRRIVVMFILQPRQKEVDHSKEYFCVVRVPKFQENKNRKIFSFILAIQYSHHPHCLRRRLRLLRHPTATTTKE